MLRAGSDADRLRKSSLAVAIDGTPLTGAAGRACGDGADRVYWKRVYPARMKNLPGCKSEMSDACEAEDESWYQLLVLSLDPPPSVGFVLVPVPGTGVIHQGASRAHLHQLLERFARTIDSAATVRNTADLDRTAIPTHPALSSREQEIVGRLIAGDRVPAIAKALFLSPSTVRNHLSSVFRKFDVSSQQELIDLLRRKDIPPTRQ